MFVFFFFSPFLLSIQYHLNMQCMMHVHRVPTHLDACSQTLQQCAVNKQCAVSWKLEVNRKRKCGCENAEAQNYRVICMQRKKKKSCKWRHQRFIRIKSKFSVANVGMSPKQKQQQYRKLESELFPS